MAQSLHWAAPMSARALALPGVTLGALLSFGCNSLTGADDLVAAAPPPGAPPDDPDEDTGVETTATPPTCPAVPAGPYGISTGDVIDPALSWPGFHDDRPAEGVVRMAEYFDCTADKGIHALLFITVGLDCEPCQAEAEQLAEVIEHEWAPEGIRVISLVLGDVEDAGHWRDTYELSDSAVVADPDASLVAGVPVTPFHVVVDPRTLAVEHRREGWVSPYPELLELAKANAAQVP